MGELAVCTGSKLRVYRSAHFSANNLREDYKFYHTFSTETAQFLKVSPGKLVMMQPEKFQSKYESKSSVMDIQVGEGARASMGPLEGQPLGRRVLAVPPGVFAVCRFPSPQAPALGSAHREAPGWISGGSVHRPAGQGSWPPPGRALPLIPLSGLLAPASLRCPPPPWGWLGSALLLARLCCPCELSPVRRQVAQVRSPAGQWQAGLSVRCVRLCSVAAASGLSSSPPHSTGEGAPSSVFQHFSEQILGCGRGWGAGK